jgi:hypothetical protein
MTLHEQFNDPLDAIDFGFALGPCSRLGRPSLRCRILSARYIAEGFLRPPASRGEVYGGIGANGQLAWNASCAIPERPRPSAGGLQN